jgi:hypothetical protein
MVNYFTLHARVHAQRGKADRCIIYGCNSIGPFQWACISGEYKDVGDFMPMCISHHRQHDHHGERASVWLKGSNNGASKLSEEDVLDIKQRLGSELQQDLADEFGVSVTAINDINCGRTWSWL